MEIDFLNFRLAEDGAHVISPIVNDGVLPEFKRYYMNSKIYTDKNIRIPESISIDDRIYPVVSIDAMALSFYEKMETLYIPSTVRKIDWNMLGCENLMEFLVDVNNQYYCSIDGVLYSKDGEEICAYPNAKDSRYTILDGTKQIVNFTFKGCVSLSELILPISITKIGINAFYRCVLLDKIVIPDSVSPMNIGGYIDRTPQKEPLVYYRGKCYKSINNITKSFME